MPVKPESAAKRREAMVLFSHIPSSYQIPTPSAPGSLPPPCGLRHRLMARLPARYVAVDGWPATVTSMPRSPSWPRKLAPLWPCSAGGRQLTSNRMVSPTGLLV